MLSNSLHDSFPLFATKNAYAESSSLLINVAKTESSKFSSTGVPEEESTFTGKENNKNQHWQSNELKHIKPITISPVKEKKQIYIEIIKKLIPY